VVEVAGGSVVYVTDITQAAMDDSCGMRYWFHKFEGGSGILKRDTLVSLLLDTEIHRDLRMLSTLMDISPANIQSIIDETLSTLTPRDKLDTNKMELLYRRLGWFAAFAIFHEPGIRDTWETLPLPESMVLDRDPLWVIAYGDRLLRHKVAKTVVYREYIPMGHAISRERWLQSWQYNIRMHIGLAAARECDAIKDIPLQGEVMAMSRGFRSSVGYHLVHPYVWGFYNKKTEEWSVNSGDGPDWKAKPVWEFPGGVVAWVRMAGAAIARQQFPVTQNIYLNPDILKNWCDARVEREREITQHKTSALLNHYVRNVHFKKVTSNCYSLDGENCPYVHACWDKTTSLIPLRSNMFIPNNIEVLGDAR
jgi:hypothetical protein